MPTPLNTNRLPSLVVLRGPSCSGKTTTALAIRQAVGRGVAVVQQDVIRRELLREPDLPGALNIDLIATIVTRCLTGGYDVILEGILDASRYGTTLRAVIATHPGPAHVYYFGLPLEETVRRHATKPNAGGYGEHELAQWYVPNDLLGVPGEQTLSPTQTQQQIVTRIITEALPPRIRPGTAPPLPA
ncbi:kinase [Frankia sp. CNm7]|uniref:Kinase n=1 Tax=Frankia nepalensis TaxID=1836974 RepID=A0A937RHY7_9ACTN|nr:AAA family ATPase [Frankia nepalensis]MBL7499779.1 kinase [Frankia nepalensis]MBL7512264.1 kinase [Frankia nepalensis]MBL7520451.1 kinase [Frankia nepalensis]MBL7632586.1 kinase [Frankia nepalensis]